jgi:hypothetical protein
MEKGVSDALIQFFKALSGSDLGLILIAIMIPPLLLVWALFRLREEIKQQAYADIERFNGVAQMYKDNVLLVKNYEKVADGLQTVIHLSTKAMTLLVEKIDNNHYCPEMRKRRSSDGK